MTTKHDLVAFLEQHDITFREEQVPGPEFPPPDTFWEERNIRRCKNLFFRDNHGKNHFLVVFDYYKNIDIKRLQEITGRGSLTFASGWRLEKYLGLTPGFLSVFGIMNDEERHVQVILDQELFGGIELSFLPNTRGGSFLVLGAMELEKFIKSRGNEYTIAQL